MTGASLTSSKIGHRHQARSALVYVRQSSAQQLVNNQESTRMQYGLVERAVALGWPRERIVVIDDDLGRSGANAEGRPGFQRLVADVGLDRVGLVLGIEMSRLARSCKDWYQLLEVCAVFGTLIADLDGVYDPGHYNDRLLLGLKGTMSEAELYLIKQRMQSARLNKVRRGELRFGVPMGYLCKPSGEVTKDPDEQAQAVVAMIFSTFERVVTVDAVLRHFNQHGIQLPCRLRGGPHKGELEWRRTSRETLVTILKNPAFAGAYVWGRYRTDPRRKQPGRPKTGRVVVKPEDWQVCLKDHLPAYITWSQYQRNQKQLAANAAPFLGPVRHGASLLAGLVRCGRCNFKMALHYAANGRYHYECVRARNSYREPVCQSVNGNQLDELVATLALQALEPAALEVSLKVAADIEAQRTEIRTQWHQRLERAKYEAERAFRQYNAVDPENRLVARSLEKQWEKALAEQQQLEDAFARESAQTPACLTQAERESICAISRDLPALWHAKTTTVEDRQTILRHLLERVMVTVDGKSEAVELEVTWKGGHRSQTTLARPIAKLERLSNYQALLQRTAELRSQGCTMREIADALHAEGFRPARRSPQFSVTQVQELLQRQGLTKASPRTPEMVAAHEWPLPTLARELGIPKITLQRWAQVGAVHARKIPASRGEAWLVRADDSEIEDLRAKRAEPPVRATRPHAVIQAEPLCV